MNLGGPEVMVVILVALVVLGPEQLPKLMRTMGSVMSEVRKVSGGFQDEMRKAMDSVDTSGKGKPQSAGGPATQSPTPAEGVDASLAGDELNEVVARNESSTTEATTTDPAPSDQASDGDGNAPAERPAANPADRAAG